MFYGYLTAASVSVGLPTQFVHCCLVTARAFMPASLTVIRYRAGASYFRLVRPLRALKCEQARGSGGMLPKQNFEMRHSEIAFEAMFGPNMLLESPHL